jgi:hypothetical protein
MKIVHLLLFSFLIILTFGQNAPPQAFTYQAVARNGLGNPLVNQNVGLQFSILKGSTVGPIQYQENQFTTTNQYGLFSLSIGTGQVQQGSFTSIIWGNDAYYLKVGLDPTGGTNFQTMGVTQFLSVPYAMYADSARTSGSGQSYQILSFSHDTLYLSNGGNVYLGGYRDTIVYQTLSISNDTLSISHGNNVVLPTINQTLSISNDTLSISNGNHVVLPSSNVVVKFNGVPISDPSINHVMLSTTTYLTSTNYSYEFDGDAYGVRNSHFDSTQLAGIRGAALVAVDSFHFFNNGPYYVGINTWSSNSAICYYTGIDPGTIFAVTTSQGGRAAYYLPLNPTPVFLNNPYFGNCGTTISGTYIFYQIYPNVPATTGFPLTANPIQVTFTRY